ncbi:GNAT family N-acetyltransferase [Thiofilum flexile]|uniref:GNAT family N-acetyltransferase n=1 Tax=Thiofilum flexile TaxID=125627 RepID=UPI0003708E2C|nr:GNAT family N-acetyltransferase [Thiofilum flexile]
MLRLSIRAATAKDAPAVASLLVQLGYNTSAEQLKPLLNQPNEQSIDVAVLDNKIVGIISLIYFDYLPSVEKYCRITTLVVDEGLRGWGIGKHLITHAQQCALAHNCQILELTTGLQRADAQAFYEHLGFKQVSYKYTRRLP